MTASGDEQHVTKLPGEDRPVPYEPGRPITDDEALGVARRLGRLLEKRNKRPVAMSADEWPSEDALSMAAWRVPTAALYRARARAEAEGTETISDVVRALLDGYGRAAMGSTAVWVTPDEASRLRGE